MQDIETDHNIKLSKRKNTGNPFHSLVIKVFAAMFFIITSISFFASAAGVAFMSEEGFYAGAVVSLAESGLLDNWMSEDARDVFESYLYWDLQPDITENKSSSLQYYEKKYADTNTNFLFQILDQDRNVVLSNSTETISTMPEKHEYTRTYFTLNGAIFLYYGDGEYYDDGNGYYYVLGDKIYALNNVSASYIEDETDIKENAISVSDLQVKEYTMYFTLADPVSANDKYTFLSKIYDSAYQYRYQMIFICLITLVVSVLLFVYLMCAAGHRRQSDEVRPNLQDKIPYDIYIGVIAGLSTLVVLLTGEIIEYASLSSLLVSGMLVLLCTAVLMFLFLALCMTTASRLKIGKMYRNTAVFVCIRVFCRITKAAFHGLIKIFRMLPHYWKSVLLFGIIALCNLFLTIGIVDGGSSFAVLLWLLLHVLVLTLLCIYSAQMYELKKGIEKIAAGDTEYKIPTNSMFYSVKHCSDKLNCIGDGITNAVDEKLKSERLKTELITNVSHDIKTPLTSIINYIDLIKREGIENQNLKDYIEILERQSAKLKKLTEDVVEASKASTGNLVVELMPMNVIEIVNQTIGEYHERLEMHNLQPIINASQDSCQVMADGKLLWRIIDNLLSNACKYAQENTRIYFDIYCDHSGDRKKAHIIVKNISKDVLNISADELMERFTRGDRSRNTEGSGLGLSIAKSLTELQNGEFILSLDGDLFKAEIILPQV